MSSAWSLVSLYAEVKDRQTGSCSDLDIALAHPWSEEALKGLTTKDRSAASTREERKYSKYGNEKVHSSQASPNSILLVFEHFRHWGESASDYLNSLAKRSRHFEG